MSPELFDSKVQDHRRMKCSDCYALGMVIYEVLSRRRLFYQYANLVVFGKVAGGSRPERPQGMEAMWFMDDVWGMLGRCWVCQLEHRPSVKDVLWCLEEVSRSWVLLGFCLYPINPGRFSNQYRTGADRCTPTLPR